MNMDFMDDLRSNVEATEKLQFDRDWTIYAARLEGEKVQDIAVAANLSRMQVSRILSEMAAITDAILAEDSKLTRQDVFDRAWNTKSWEAFGGKPKFGMS